MNGIIVFNGGFLCALPQMKDEQNDLERKLWEERHEIQQKYDDKVKGALKKAEIIGSGISPHEAEMLQRAFRDELAKFDRERVQVAWDGLVTKQQSRLEQLRVPAMFPSSEKADIDRQRRIVQVLEGIVGGDGRT
ncbi:hypothetical protein FISHEDRAFT_48441 [Fistulina hepatica ATCC 64428]|uniref:Uncharacterized protein n=1 Tax=Fistulina hepatica ATCC 64428 TaxID=1128425 RepID=A0A0D7A5A0_9AGAR|nr:hypothetical protein FISHEDRAFT_48441 [Fistulina hepatica ATCC 64428]